MTDIKLIKDDKTYLIFHDGDNALIWNSTDTLIPVLRQMNIDWMKNRGKSIPIPEGWEIEYHDLQSMESNLYRFNWKYISTLQLMTHIFNRQHFNINMDRFPNDDTRTVGAVVAALNEIPECIKQGDGGIILEDANDRIMINFKDRIEYAIFKCGLNFDRVEVLFGIGIKGKKFFDAFESQTYFDSMLCDTDYPAKKLNPTKKFICLNRRSAPQRIMTYNEFYKRGLLEDSYFSYNHIRWQRYLIGEKTLTNYLNETKQTMEELLSLPDRVIDWPATDKPVKNGFWPGTVEMFNDSAYYIVTETLDMEFGKKFIFPTEKTYKAFLYKTPFVLIGNIGLLDYLTDLGYDVDFDNIGIEYNRSNSFMETMDLIESLPMVVTEADRARCEYNHQHLIGNAIPRCWDQVIKLLG